MAEFVDTSELEKKECEAKDTEQSSSSDDTDTDMSIDNIQQFRKDDKTPVEDLSILLQEKMKLDNEGKELKISVSNILQENLDIIEKKEEQEKTPEKIVKNEKHVAELIRNRLSAVHTNYNKFEGYFESVLESKKNNLGNLPASFGRDEAESEQKLALAESMFESYVKQVSNIELLMKPDYDIVCREEKDCFDVVMSECNKVEEMWRKLMAILLEI